MAIDSATKRRSISAMMPPFGVGVTPDATTPSAWRHAAGWSYAGAAVATGGGGTGPVWAAVKSKERVRGGVLSRRRDDEAAVLAAFVAVVLGEEP